MAEFIIGLSIGLAVAVISNYFWLIYCERLKAMITRRDKRIEWFMRRFNDGSWDHTDTKNEQGIDQAL